MELRTAYCATCERPVRVLVQADAPAWSDPWDADFGTVVCLEHGETCTGAMCPVFEVPSAQMKESLEAYRRTAGGGPG